MKKLTLAITMSLMFAASASAVDISHDFSYGSSVVTGNAQTYSKTVTDSQVIKFATDADKGFQNLGATGIQAVDNSAIIDSAYSHQLPSAGVDNTVAGTSIDVSTTHSTANANDRGTFSSVTAFNEATITVGALTAGEGNRVTVFAQVMEGSSSTNGTTDTVKVDFNTSTNNGAENGVEYKVETSHTDFGSNVTDKVSTTRKNTITDYSFIK